MMQWVMDKHHTFITGVVSFELTSSSISSAQGFRERTIYTRT